jgi:signal transduction histidine kinase
MTLRRRLLASFLVLAIVPISAAATAWTIVALCSAKNQAREELRTRVESLAHQIASQLESEGVYLQRTMGRLPPEMLRKPEEGHKSFDLLQGVAAWFARDPRIRCRYLFLRPAVRAATVVHGVVRIDKGSTTRLFAKMPNPSSLRDIYKRLLAGEITIPPGEVCYLTDMSLGEPVVAVVVRESNSRSKEALFLVQEVPVVPFLGWCFSRGELSDVDRIFAMWPSPQLGKPRFLYHSDPRWIGLPASRKTQEQDLAFAVDVGRPPAARSPPAHADLLDRDLLLYGQLVEPTGWMLGAGLDLSERSSMTWQRISLALALLAAMAVLVTLGILRVTRGVGRAAEAISATAEAVAKGDFERVANVRRKDEFGLIAAHINRMAEELSLTAESRSMTQLSSRLVHDLKGVLSQMKLLIYNLEENRDDEEFQGEFVELMRGLVQQVESTILQLRRGDAESQVQWEACDVDSLLQEVLASPLVTARRKIEAAEDLKSGGPCTGNARMLRDVFKNVIANAVEAMESGGTLRVKTRRSGRSETRGGATHEIEIEDSGAGMSNKFIEERLFRPFETTKAKGMGLGMYQVRRILEQLGGDVEVESEPGRGTRVRIRVGRPPSEVS